MTGGHCWPLGGEADGVEGVRLAVRRLLKEGIDWIKVMATGGGTANTYPYRASYRVEELRAAVEEAHAYGRLTAAHASGSAGILNALEAGFDMIVHCSFNGTDGRYAFQPDLARRIVDQGVWVNPTLHVNRVHLWHFQRLAEQRPLTEAETAELEKRRLSQEEKLDCFQRLLAAGVRMVAGSDSGWGRYLFGGFCHEVEAMAVAGLGAPEALRAATLESARAMGLEAEVGSLEPGKRADLLLVEGDPTVDPTALSRVKGVFLGGQRVYKRLIRQIQAQRLAGVTGRSLPSRGCYRSQRPEAGPGRKRLAGFGVSPNGTFISSTSLEGGGRG